MTSLTEPPVRNRTEVISEMGTKLARYMSMLLPRLTTKADTTAMTPAARNMWFTGLFGSQHSQGIRPQAQLMITCVTRNQRNQDCGSPWESLQRS